MERTWSAPCLSLGVASSGVRGGELSDLLAQFADIASIAMEGQIELLYEEDNLLGCTLSDGGADGLPIMEAYSYQGSGDHWHTSSVIDEAIAPGFQIEVAFAGRVGSFRSGVGVGLAVALVSMATTLAACGSGARTSGPSEAGATLAAGGLESFLAATDPERITAHDVRAFIGLALASTDESLRLSVLTEREFAAMDDGSRERWQQLSMERHRALKRVCRATLDEGAAASERGDIDSAVAAFDAVRRVGAAQQFPGATTVANMVGASLVEAADAGLAGLRPGP